jgi:hypothetical protein
VAGRLTEVLVSGQGVVQFARFVAEHPPCRAEIGAFASTDHLSWTSVAFVPVISLNGCVAKVVEI